MEKLQVSKSKNKAKIKPNSKNNPNFKKTKNAISKKQSLKNNLYLQTLLNSKFASILIFIAFCLCIVLCFTIFSNNAYYIFLNRPKILENSATLIILIVLFLSLLFLTYFFNVFVNVKSFENNQKKAGSFNQSENVDFDKNYPKFAKNIVKNANFKQIFAIFVLFLLLFVVFCFHWLWVCTLISFIIFFVIFVLLIKGKTRANKITYFVLLINQFCILCSFYLIYLLN